MLYPRRQCPVEGFGAGPLYQFCYSFHFIKLAKSWYSPSTLCKNCFPLRGQRKGLNGKKTNVPFFMQPKSRYETL